MYFLSIYGIFVLSLMSPGPDFAIVLRNSLTRSRRDGLLSSVGVTLGLVVHMIYILLGLGVALTKAPKLFFMVQVLGALYLGFLGLQALRSGKNKKDVNNAVETKAKSALWEGFLTNLLNPKATVFLISLFAQLIQSESEVKFQYIFAVLILLSALAWFSFLALVLSYSGIQKRMAKVQPKLDKVMGCILLVFSLKILMDLF